MECPCDCENKNRQYMWQPLAFNRSFTGFIVIHLFTSGMTLVLQKEALGFLGSLGNRIHEVDQVGR